jgi:hypothetical protein
MNQQSMTERTVIVAPARYGGVVERIKQYFLVDVQDRWECRVVALPLDKCMVMMHKNTLTLAGLSPNGSEQE